MTDVVTELETPFDDDSRSQTRVTQELFETVMIKLEHIDTSQKALLATQRTQGSQIAEIHQKVRVIQSDMRLADLLQAKDEEIATLRRVNDSLLATNAALVTHVAKIQSEEKS